MEEWKEYRLGDICDTISDTYKRNSPQVVLINTSDVLEGKCLNHIPVPNKNLKGQFKKTFCNEDILYSEIRPANKRFAYIDFEPKDYIASTKLMVIRSKEEVLPKYLYYILQSNQMLDKLQTLAETRSGTFPQITFSELAAQKIILPGLNSQKKIVQVLESINSKIELNRRINENLEQQAQALFKSWFVDFEPFKDGKFVDSELGKIPEGWCVVEASKFMKISKESINPFKNPNRCYVHYSIPAFDDTALPVLQYGSEIKSNKLNVSDGMTLVSKLNPRIKRVWFIDKACENSICSTEFIPYKSLNDCNYFLYCYLNSDIFYNTIMSFVNGATGSHQRFQPNETLKFLFAYNEGVIKKFNSLVKNILKYKYKLTIQNQTLSRLRDNLLPKLMSGEINI